MSKKIFNCILIVIIILTSLPVMSIAYAIEDRIIAIKQVAETNITTVDLTGISTGTDATHTHIYEQKYDDNYHWQQCFICSDIQNKITHTKVKTDYVTGTPSCYYTNTYTIYCQDGCGYSYATTDSHGTVSEYKTEPSRSLHFKYCLTCGGWTTNQQCYKSDGSKISCTNLGTCVVCNYTYTQAAHRISSRNSSNIGTCDLCGVQYIQVISETLTYGANYETVTYSWKLKAMNGAVLLNNIPDYHIESIPYESISTSNTVNADGTITYSFTGKFNGTVQTKNTTRIETRNNIISINGTNTHYFITNNLFAWQDHTAPSAISATVSGNGTASAFSIKAIITASVKETYSDLVSMRLVDSDGTTVISDWGTATKNGTTYTRIFDVIAETKGSKKLYLQSQDRFGNVLTQEVTVQYLDSKAPTLYSQTGNTTAWATSKQITYTALDEGSGQVQIGFNNQSDFALGTQSGNYYARTYKFVGDVYGTVTAALYLKDAVGNVTTQKVTISNIDNTKPTINNVSQLLSADKKSVGINISANDYNASLGKEGSGVSGYAITKDNAQPSNFQGGNTFTINENGTYYVWVTDAVGNVSVTTILVKDIEVVINGTITWNDSNNEYSSRVGTNLKIYRKIGSGTGELATTLNIQASQTSYSTQLREVNDSGEKYTYWIEQGEIDGYETIVSGYNVTNNLVLPIYTSEISVTPIDSFENKILKNSQVKIVGKVAADSSNREKVGVYTGVVTFVVDDGIKIDKNSITVTYETASGTKTNITNYSITGNTITAYFGSNTNGISEAGDKITIEIDGVIQEIKTLDNSIKLEGKLRDYRGKNTAINLGVITTSSKQEKIEYQIPEAKIQLKKIDSITGQIITDATFGLYEWNGSEYVRKEEIKDNNKDGIYESNVYRWNVTTQGKYKLVEEGIPNYHKDLNFSMEYSLKEYQTEAYIVNVDYDNKDYIIKYKVREPDDFDKVNGIVENEPWKLNVKIVNKDEETGNDIQSNGEFTIYEWNKDINNYEEYVSYTSGNKVEVARQSNLTYISNEWLYYTQKNEGKYKIVQTKAPEGYYGDYENAVKREYEINIIDIINTGVYGSQSVGNESTIILSNNEDLTIENKRVKATLDIIIVDSETDGIAQTDAVLSGAIYGLYAISDIYHADGITTRYDGIPGLLYEKDELITQNTTNEEAKINFSDLECGKYYIKMIKPSEGYILDTNKYGIDFSYQGEEKENLSLYGKIKIQVKKQAFQMYKLKENQTTLENAGFEVYLISNLSIVKEGKIERYTKDRYILKDEKAAKDSVLNAKENADGTYNISDLIDYYYKIQYVEDNKDSLPGDDVVYHPYNLVKEELVKNYANTEAGETIQEIRTDENGYLKSPELAYGEYIVIETSVPREFSVAKPFVVDIEKDSREAQGLRFIIDNNFMTRVKIYIKDENTGETILKQGAKYVIRNEETKELVTQVVWTGTNGYTQVGTEENPFIIGSEGYLITPFELPIGKYVLEEIKASEGYIKNGYEGYSENGQLIADSNENVYFEISSNTAYYMDSYLDTYIIVVNILKEEALGTIKVKAEGEYLSDAIKLEDGYQFKYTKRAVPNVEYDVYVREDIYTQDGQGTKYYAENQKVGTIITNEYGEAIIENLPQGKYYIKETVAGKGFYIEQEEKDVEITYEGEEVAVIFRNVNSNEARRKYNIRLQNKDKETGEIISGGEYGIYNKNIIEYTDDDGNKKTVNVDELIYVAECDEEGYIIFDIDLPQGKYYIKEITPPKGYIKDEDAIYIELSDNNNGDIEIENPFEKSKTKININNISSMYARLFGAKVVIQEENETEVMTLELAEELNMIKGLEINKTYYARMTYPSKGYVSADKVSFMILSNGELSINEEYSDPENENTIRLVTNMSKMNILVVEKGTEDKISNIGIEIKGKETKEVIASTEEQDGILKIEQTENGYEIQGIPIGKYVLTQKSIPYEKGYVEAQTIEIEVKDEDSLQEIKIEQEISKLLIEVKDDNSNLVDADITLIKKDTEEEIQVSNLTQEGCYIEKLSIGVYKVQVKVQDGYLAIENKEYYIEDRSEIQIIEFTTRKLEFDLSIDKELEKILINKDEIKVKTNEMRKIEVKEAKLKEEDIKLQYSIVVKNEGEVEGTITNILEKIPSGFSYVSEDSDNWNENGQKIEYTDEIILKPGESKKLTITIKWNNGAINFGTKTNTVEIKEYKNIYEYKDINMDNNKDSIDTVMSLKTGDEVKLEIVQIILLVFAACMVICLLAGIEIIILKRKNK